MKRLSVLLLVAGLASPAPPARAQSTLVLDSLYGTDGFHRIDVGPEDHAEQLLDIGNGQWLFGGYSSVQPGRASVTLYKADRCGAPVPGFGVNGVASSEFPNAGSFPLARGYGFALQPDGKIVVAGEHGTSAGSSRTPTVFRFNASGTPDLAFGDFGAVNRRYDGISSGLHRRVFVLPNGRILAAGYSSGNANGGTSGFGAMRFFANGAVDTTYGGGTGKVRYDAPIYGAVAAERQSTGKLVVTGNLSVGPMGKLAMVRFDTAGVLDPTFGTMGYAEFPAIVVSERISAVMLPSDKLLIAWGEPNGSTVKVARFQANGTLDPTFATGGIGELPTGFSSGMKAWCLRLDASGRLLVGGAVFQNGYRGMLARFTAGGQPDATFCTGGLYVSSGLVFGPTSQEYFYDVWALPNSQFLLFGDSYDNGYTARLTPTSSVPHVSYTFPRLTTTGTGTYQWLLNGAPVAGATANPYQPQAIGAWSVTLTDGTGCAYTSAPVTVSQVAMGLEDEAAGAGDARMRLYPNPTTGALTLMVPAALVGQAYTLTDGMGRVVRAGWLTAPETLLLLTDLPAGLYGVRATSQRATCFLKL